MTNPLRRVPWLLSLALLGACDNVGRAFDPSVDPDDPDPGTTESTIEIVPVGGDVRTGRPKVRATYPSGGGWPVAVPVVVEFNESVNQASIAPSSPGGNDGRIVLRARGAPTPVPCAYDFLAEGRLLVMRPVTALTDAQSPTYEVVLLPDARDADGVRFEVPAEGLVLAEFQVNQADTFTDGRILALYPRENARDFAREGEVFVVFDRPATAATVVAANLQVRPAGGAPISGTITLPIQTVGVADGRVARFTPSARLEPSTEYELVVTADIRFGADGELDFRGRTPFSRFETVAPAAPAGIALQNPTTGFDNRINIDNAQSAVLRVIPPDDALAGDRVNVRVYGGDADTAGTGDLGFVERTAELTQPGNAPVDVDLAGALGTLANPRFDEGELTFAVQLQRGSQTSGFVHHADDAAPSFDITRPSVQRVGGPAAGNGTDVWCDTTHVAVWGQANERLASATLVAEGARTAELFASDDDGNFLLKPITLGRLVTAIGYNVTVVDDAGNMAAATFSGSIAQRGAITGALAGELVVEAYDEATLAPIAGAAVLVDPGVPVVPASGRFSDTTAGNGRAAFGGVVGPSHTITIVAPGYDLVTLYDTRASFVSLPLRPVTNATASLTGDVLFPPAPGVSAIVGSTAVADRGVVGARTTNAAPNTIPSTPILPNRAQVVTGFAGAFEPTGNPPFVAHGAQLLGPTLTEPTPPAPPVAGGESSEQRLTLVPSTAQTAGLPPGVPGGARIRDFALATGLDTGTFVAPPRVRVTGSLAGFESQALLGVGWLASTTGAAVGVDAAYSTTIALGLAPFAPLLWCVTEVTDGAGRVSRSRGLVVPSGLAAGTYLSPGPIAIPAVTVPGGASTGSPQVEFVDGLAVAGPPWVDARAYFELTASGPAGRRWLVLVPDRDGVGTDTVQLPELTGVTGLAAGAWTIGVEGRVWSGVTGASLDDLVVTERVRVEIDYARSAPVTFTVQ